MSHINAASLNELSGAIKESDARPTGVEFKVKKEYNFRVCCNNSNYLTLYPKIAQYSPYYLFFNVCFTFKGSNYCILFAITAAGDAPCDGPKMSPRTSSIVQVIFFLSFGISKGIQSFQNTFRNILLSNVLII